MKKLNIIITLVLMLQNTIKSDCSIVISCFIVTGTIIGAYFTGKKMEKKDIEIILLDMENTLLTEPKNINTTSQINILKKAHNKIK